MKDEPSLPPPRPRRFRMLQLLPATLVWNKTITVGGASEPVPSGPGYTFNDPVASKVFPVHAADHPEMAYQAATWLGRAAFPFANTTFKRGESWDYHPPLTLSAKEAMVIVDWCLSHQPSKPTRGLRKVWSQFWPEHRIRMDVLVDRLRPDLLALSEFLSALDPSQRIVAAYVSTPAAQRSHPKPTTAREEGAG